MDTNGSIQESFKSFEFQYINNDITNYYICKKGFLDDEIQYIIDQVPEEKLQVALLGEKCDLKQKLRSTKVFFLPRIEQFKNYYHKIADMVVDANMKLFHFKISSFRESIQYSVYDAKDNGHYSWHMDIGSGFSHRKLSVVIMMSDPSEYEGGDLEIWFDKEEPVKIEKEKGNIIIFPSYLLHRVTPVTKGTRRTLVTWITGPAFR